ncbi:MAG: branched-chain amino acid ABC transporter substrate-binding protein [Proteobacteria bacterium]|nr:branched-chain amino acid ABC transporter substrate-binding protein [Pseudomonadota bacterium]
MTVGRLFVASLMSTLLLAACAGPSGPTREEIAAAEAKVVADAGSARAAAAEDNRVVIGLAGPLTGDLQKYGLEMRRGAELAVADLNAAGGVLGRRLVLEVADDHCGKQEAESAAKELIQKGAVFVDGHFCSGSSIEGSEVYGPADVLQITPSVTNGLLTDIAVQRKVTTLLRVVGRDEMQGDFAAEWLAKAHAGGPIVVLSDNSAYGQGISRHLYARLTELGVRSVLSGEFVQGQSSYANLIAKLKEVRPSAIYVAAYHDDIGRLTWALRVAKIDAEIIGPDVLSSPEFWSFSQMRGNGVRYSDMAPAAERPEAADIVARLRAGGGGEPTNYSLNAYAAIQVFAEAAKATKGVDAKAIGDYLRQNSVKTILGELKWDAKGDLIHADYIWYVWQDGLAVRQ